MAAVQSQAHNPPARGGLHAIEIPFGEQLQGRFDPGSGTLWLGWSPRPRPCFNPDLLRACVRYGEYLRACAGAINCGGETIPVQHSVLCSDIPGVFNLGGDLDLFVALIEQRDHAALLEYGNACVEAVQQNYQAYGLPVTTVSLVQGECLGGGFEAALSSHIIIAERSARFGFPEILFNLFPGMGAMSFVHRRGDTRAGEALVSSGRVVSAEELLQIGLIDAVVDDGTGEAAVTEWLARESPLQRTLRQVRHRVRRITRAELDDIVAVWVDAALRINPRDLRLMTHLVARQDRIK